MKIARLSDFVCGGLMVVGALYVLYSYLPAIFGQRASDNAIFISPATSIDNLVVDPPVFYPVGSVGSSKSILTFDLSSTADVLMTIDDIDSGTEISRRTYRDVPVGDGRVIEWDGRNSVGELVAPGGYRISLIAQNRFGQSALPARVMQRVRY